MPGPTTISLSVSDSSEFGGFSSRKSRTSNSILNLLYSCMSSFILLRNLTQRSQASIARRMSFATKSRHAASTLGFAAILRLRLES